MDYMAATTNNQSKIYNLKLNKSIAFYFLFFTGVVVTFAQQDTATVGSQSAIAQDDPAQFLTRVEVFNELQHHKSVDYLKYNNGKNRNCFRKKIYHTSRCPLCI